ncbi:unnamed protein product [Rotaria sordida]|uniref:Uncharacterized protein n=1 Tax=Rotaria sordida TaxID=392033 RepID=A0A819S0Q2_9BILA|nr:unnamed protein product [Rotaria sordida]
MELLLGAAVVGLGAYAYRKHRERRAIANAYITYDYKYYKPQYGYLYYGNAANRYRALPYPYYKTGYYNIPYGY